MATIQIDFVSLEQAHWSDLERENARRITEFVQLLMNDHDFDAVLERFGNDRYVQHNRAIPDGFPALVSYVRDFAKRFPDYTYDVKRILADGDYVHFHSHVTTRARHRGDDTKGLNISDTWRLRDGQIVEHWDAIQPIDAFMRVYLALTGGRIRNGNGVF